MKLAFSLYRLSTTAVLPFTVFDNPYFKIAFKAINYTPPNKEALRTTLLSKIYNDLESRLSSERANMLQYCYINLRAINVALHGRKRKSKKRKYTVFSEELEGLQEEETAEEAAELEATELEATAREALAIIGAEWEAPIWRHLQEQD